MRKILLAALAALSITTLLVDAGFASASTNPPPLVVRIEAAWCPACHATQATFDKIKSEYAGKVQFVELDVTDATTAGRSQVVATRLGILDFYNRNKTSTSMVALIDPRTHAVRGTLYNDTNQTDYEHLINSAVHHR